MWLVKPSEAMLAILVLWVFACSADGLELTQETWKAKTAGKSVFVKFYAPWCGHCQKMQPAWDALMQDYAGHPTVLVAKVDCVGSGKDLCEAKNIDGFPALLHGDPERLQIYEGERDAASLSAFAQSHLGPLCNPGNLAACSAEQKGLIQRFMALPADDLADLIEVKEDSLKAADKAMQGVSDSLRLRHEEGQRRVDDARRQAFAEGLGFMRMVESYQARKASGEL